MGVIETLLILTVVCGLYVIAGGIAEFMRQREFAKDVREQEEDIW